MKTLPTVALATALLAAGSWSFAQVAETNPVGFNTVECLPESDTYCGVPLARPHVFFGRISQVTPGQGVQAGRLVVQPEGSQPGWESDQFQNLFFVRLISGAKAGMYYQITANNSGTVTVDLAGALAVGFAAGDEFRIHPFWTLSTLFLPATQTTVVPSTSPAPAGRRTLILIPDLTGEGTNLAPTQTFFLVGANWQAPGGVMANDFILPPDSYFVVRHNHVSITESTFFRPIGSVEMNDLVTPLATRAGGQQDNFSPLDGRFPSN
jgi:uncharacterized protein (TIGR02597 family)